MDKVVDLTELSDHEESPLQIVECVEESPLVVVEENELLVEEDVTDLVSPDDKGADDEELKQVLADRSKSLRRVLDLGKKMRERVMARNESQAQNDVVCVTESGPPVEMSKGQGSRDLDFQMSQVEDKSVKKKRGRLTEEEKRAREKARADATALRKLQRQVQSERYVLKFIQVVMGPEVMGQPLGLGIGQAFQSTNNKAEHEKIVYHVRQNNIYGYPLIRWTRMTPSAEGTDSFSFENEPFTMICIEGNAMVEWIETGEFQNMLDRIGQDGHKISIIVHRLQHTISQREIHDHREAMSQSSGVAQAPGFCSERVRQYLASILVEMPEVELFDVNSVDEAANHVVAMTKAISMRLIEEGAAAKYLAGKSKRRSASVALNELLAVEPLQRPELLCPIQALCALPSVGPRSAHALAHKFSSLKGLIEMLEDKSTSLGEKKVMLGNIFSTNGRRVGPKAAQQIVDVFLSEDPYLRFDD